MNRLIVNADLPEVTIDRHIYGHFAEHLGRCIYEGIWVGEDGKIGNRRGIRTDVVDALKRLDIPNLRWPGGCFADEYHWRDGIGERGNRPSTVNTHWGGVTEPNAFGTHEFLDLCEQLGCEPYICGNVGSGELREMGDWIEYLTFSGTSRMADLRRENGRGEPWKIRFWGVGNENWGCGGRMTPEYYADLYRRYSTYCKNLSDNTLFRIACGPSVADYHWTEVLMREAGRFMDGLSLHYYTSIIEPGVGRVGSATKFEEADWFTYLKKALYMDELITRHSAIMDQYDPDRRVALVVDEWGTWYAVEPGTHPRFLYQQNSMRDALVASLTLDVFNRHAERVRMANLAQTINVLQAVILTEGEKMLLTPTYHVFEMYKVHQDAQRVPLSIESEEYRLGEETMPSVHGSASVDKEGKLHITLSNSNPREEAAVSIALRGRNSGPVTGRLLTAGAMTAHNTFDAPDTVAPVSFDGVKRVDSGLEGTLPPMSVVVLELG